MTRTIGYCILICLASVLVCTSMAATNVLSDSNTFLASFVNHEFINVLGVFLAIMLPAIASIHFAFNNIEERHEHPGLLVGSRLELRKAVNWLVVLFVYGILVAAFKPLQCYGPVGEALFNSTALLILAWMALIFYSQTLLVLQIGPTFKKQFL